MEKDDPESIEQKKSSEDKSKDKNEDKEKNEKLTEWNEAIKDKIQNDSEEEEQSETAVPETVEEKNRIWINFFHLFLMNRVEFINFTFPPDFSEHNQLLLIVC